MAIPFMHTRPRYFAQIMGELLYWIGEDRIMFASDYAIWQPKWLVEQFVDFQIPEDLQGEYGHHNHGHEKARSSASTPPTFYDIEVPSEDPADSGRDGRR